MTNKKTVVAKTAKAIAFVCKSHRNGWATFASQTGQVSARPIITWETKHFGGYYSPQNRCKIVSEKLTNAVVNNGGLQNLNLRSGGINVNNKEYIVICATAAAQPKCDRQNMLFTLKPENAKNPNKVLRQMLNYTRGIDANQGIDEDNLPSFISLERLVNNVSTTNFQEQFLLSAPLAASFLAGLLVGGALMFWVGKRLAKRKVEHLQELLRKKQSQGQTLEKQVKALETKMDAVKSQETEAKTEIKQLQELLQGKESQRQQEVERLQGLLQEEKSQRQNLERQSKTVEAEIETLKSQETAAKAKSISSPKADSEEVELKSTKNIDYNRLRDLLVNLQFREADEETWRCMLKATGQENYLRNEDIDNFPCEDLQTIDRLWVKYSKGRFGFSIQQQIYLQAGGAQKHNQQVWEIVSASFGWRNSGSASLALGSLGEQLGALSNLAGGWGWFAYSDLSFGKNSPYGNLPCGGCLRGGWDGWFMGGGEGFSRLMERLSTCQQHN